MSRLLIIIFGLVWANNVLAKMFTVYVSTLGKDSYDGFALNITPKSGPVASLERARDIVRAIRKEHPKLAKPIEVVIAPGVYRRVSAFELNELDSGTPQSPTIYRALEPRRTVISGAIQLEANEWKKCEQCKAGIYVYQLSDTVAAMSGSLVEDGFWHTSNDGYAELYYDSKKMPIARWPKQGFLKVDSVVSSIHFHAVAEQNPSQEMEADKNMWARGYWTNGWADYAKKISIIPAKQTLFSLSNDSMPYPVALNDRFFLFNGLSLMNSVNDWFFAEKDHHIYFWSPDAMKTTPEWAVAKNLVIAKKVSYVQFHGLIFQQTRGDLLNLNDVNNIDIKNCQIYGSNGWGIVFVGKNSQIINNVISETGLGGIKLVGGSRIKLEKSNLIVSDNKINNFAQRVKTYQPGISIYGVGVLVSRNEISFSPHAGIILHGNNHVIENNIIHHVMLEASDGGAIYMGRDWTERGVIIRKNYLYDINSTDSRLVMGVYLDDQASGVKVYDNIFWSVNRAVFIGGGSDNHILNNTYIKSTPGIFLDNRGMEVQKAITINPKAEFQTRLHQMPYNSSKIWLTSYPELKNIIEDGLGIPRRNKFSKNVFISSMPYELRIPNSVKKLQNIDEAQIINNKALPPKAPKTIDDICSLQYLATMLPQNCTNVLP